MNSHNRQFDVVVLGAGSAGSAVAFFLAKRGFKTALLEKRELNQAGARWINAVPPWLFDRASLPRPQPPELRNNDFILSMKAFNGKRKIEIPKSPIWQIYMPRLVERLQNYAREARAELFGRFTPELLIHENERPKTLEGFLREPSGERRKVSFSAALFIDATGFKQALLRMSPRLSALCPLVGKRDICDGYQELCHIADIEGAKRFLQTHSARENELVNFAGLYGGFSTLCAKIERGYSEVDLLAGAIKADSGYTGRDILSEFRSKNGWIGEKISEGGGPIPIRKPYDRFTAAGIALVGDSACHVFPAHGSGVGTGLCAARLLSDALRGPQDIGAEETLWKYQVAFQREFGSINAAYEVFKNFTQNSRGKDMEQFIENGMITEESFIAGLEEELPDLEREDILSAARPVLFNPLLLARFAPAIAKMQANYLLYKAYPRRYGKRFYVWRAAVNSV